MPLDLPNSKINFSRAIPEAYPWIRVILAQRDGRDVLLLDSQDGEAPTCQQCQQLIGHNPSVGFATSYRPDQYHPVFCLACASVGIGPKLTRFIDLLDRTVPQLPFPTTSFAYLPHDQRVAIVQQQQQPPFPNPPPPHNNQQGAPMDTFTFDDTAAPEFSFDDGDETAAPAAPVAPPPPPPVAVPVAAAVPALKAQVKTEAAKKPEIGTAGLTITQIHDAQTAANAPLLAALHEAKVRDEELLKGVHAIFTYLKDPKRNEALAGAIAIPLQPMATQVAAIHAVACKPKTAAPTAPPPAASENGTSTPPAPTAPPPAAAAPAAAPAARKAGRPPKAAAAPEAAPTPSTPPPAAPTPAQPARKPMASYIKDDLLPANPNGLYIKDLYEILASTPDWRPYVTPAQYAADKTPALYNIFKTNIGAMQVGVVTDDSGGDPAMAVLRAS